MTASLVCTAAYVGRGCTGRVRVWNVTAEKQTMEATLKEHRAPVTSIAVMRDNTQCVTASEDGSCIVWDITNYLRVNAMFANTNFSTILYHPDESQYPDSHKFSSKGVVPGYQGHVPKARDTFGSSAMGGLAPEPHIGSHKKMGAMAGHAEPVPWEKDYDWETQVYNGFSGTKNGVIPGYAGFRPGARDVDGVAAFGGIPHDGPSGHGDNPKLKSDWDQGRMKPDTDYRQVVHGIVPGYTGHVPNAIDKHGTTYFGKITKDGDQRTITKDQLYVEDGADSGDGGTHFGAQRGHTNSLLDKCNDVTMNRKSGYSGHMPASRDAFGTTVFNPR